MENVLKNINKLITADNIALLSVIITILIFIISRHIEIRYKRHDDKKIQYLKLIDLMQKSLSDYKKNRKGEPVLTDEMKKQFFDTGASLLLYGSKKIYRQYLLFREFTTNPLITQCKYYKDSIVIYIMGDILRTMRKEVGLSYFNSIRSNEALAFFVNDIASNPLARQNEMDANCRIKMVRFELAIIDRTQFIFIKRIYTDFIRPIFAGISIIIKHIVIIPLGHLLMKLFPKLFDRIQTNDKLPK
ncbi:MAG: hypothetical protein OSJ58_12600 [Dysosmobacter sp.]|uniref:hypothetical protein n=1 Tax=uncultured Oscillibacter sp. TaxID=876091 RepID=UPI002622281F|nr:hypothetical protein [uncultured Oscillibacter sp.]MCX4372641.1 hypothetical protein [Dysosmobacter sp.]